MYSLISLLSLCHSSKYKKKRKNKEEKEKKCYIRENRNTDFFKGTLFSACTVTR